MIECNMLALPKPRRWPRQRFNAYEADRPKGATRRTYHAAMTRKRDWIVTAIHGHWYESVDVDGVEYFFNPEPLHLGQGCWRVTIKNGWPHFKNVTNLPRGR
jgi:hypothetical protein